MDTTIKEMQVILTIVKEGSASKAADKLFLTQPAVSRIVKRIENRLGIPIFDKSGYPWKLTAIGRLFIEKTEKIIQIETDFQKFIPTILNKQKKYLPIGTLFFEEKHFMPKVLTFFYEKYPDFSIEFFSNQTLELEKAILNNSVEFSLLVMPILNKDIEYEPLKTYEILVVLPKNNPLCKNYIYPIDGKSFPKIDLHQIQNYPFIFLNKKNLIRKAFLDACTKVNFKPKKILEVEKIEMAHSFSIAGHGATFVLDAIEKHPDMAYYKVKGAKAIQTIALGYRKNKKFSQAEKDFLSILKKVLNS